MRRDSDYEALLSQYRVAVAQIKILRGQIAEKDSYMSEYEQRVSVSNDRVRELCEMILAKDRSEMKLGPAKPWSAYSVDELVAKAKKSYVAYNEARTELMRSIADKLTASNRERDNLQEQIRRMQAGKEVSGITADEILEAAKREEETTVAMDRMPNALKKAVKAGKIECIVEEIGDVEDEEEIREIAGLVSEATKAKLTPGATPIARCQKKADAMKKASDDVVSHMINVNQYLERCGEYEWLVFEAIGKRGLSRYPDIEADVTGNNTYFKNRTRQATLALVNMGALTQECLSLPISKKSKYIRMTDLGKRMYFEHFGEEVCQSEIERVCKEHDNAEHGYGIMDLEKVLTQSGRYLSVSAYNRKEAIPVTVNGRELKYIPDLICKTERYTEYMEYERGLHTQDDFAMKCNKMCKVTRFLNFVTPSKEIAGKVKVQVDKWIAVRGADTLKSVVIRITTAIALREANEWYVEYRLSQSPDPIRCDV